MDNNFNPSFEEGFEDIDFEDEESQPSLHSSDDSSTDENYSSVTYGIKTNDFSAYRERFMKQMNDSQEFEDFDESFDEPDTKVQVIDLDKEAENEYNSSKLVPEKKDIGIDDNYSDDYDYPDDYDDMPEDLPEGLPEDQPDDLPPEETFDGGEEVIKEETSFEYEKEPSPELKDTCEKIIDNTKLLCKVVGDEALKSLFVKIDEDNRKAAKEHTVNPSNTITNTDNVPLREYTNKTVIEEPVYDEPIDVEKSIGQKLVPYIIFSLLVSSLFGVKSNSYYNYKLQFMDYPEQLRPTDCIIGWIATDNIPVTLMPFNPAVFFTSFGVLLAISAIVSFLIFSKNEEKEKARVGHEHGSARLSTRKDFMQYRQKFME